MNTRDFSAVAFMVVGLLYFAYAVSLLQFSLMFVASERHLVAIGSLLPIVVLIYLGFLLIRNRDRLSQRLFPDPRPDTRSGITRRDLLAVSIASVGLFLIGLGFPGVLEVIVTAAAATRACAVDSVTLEAKHSLPPDVLSSMVPHAARVGSQFVLGLALLIGSRYLAARTDQPSSTRDDA